MTYHVNKNTATKIGENKAVNVEEKCVLKVQFVGRRWSWKVVFVQKQK